MQLSEQTKIEAQLGFTWGILVGALASWVFIIFFTSWEWYFKLFSSIGEVGIVGTLLLTINELIKARRNYLETLKEMEKINKESSAVINSQEQMGDKGYTMSSPSSAAMKSDYAGMSESNQKHTPDDIQQTKKEKLIKNENRI